MKYILSLIILFVTQLLYFKIADKFNIIDKPNQRSSHTKITLRGGGIIFYLGILLYFIIDGFQYPYFFAGLTLISLISFADDIKPRSAKLRLAIHFISMLLMFYQWDLFSWSWYFIIIALILCTGIINAFNFMDGINGITGGYSLVVIAALWFINSYQVHFIDNDLIYFIALALLVFNFFNFRKKAKCFAGDVGAVSVAFIILFLLGLLIISTNDFSYIVLLAVYGVDSILTIIHRLILKENIFDAHRKHAYQIMANELKIPHIIVSAIYMLLQALVIIGFFVFNEYKWIYIIIVISVLSMAYILFMKKKFHLHKESLQK
ncbi:UDP-GlcNAc--UDP-phosphate GlcNAc-1-phosphate transferase [Paludibacter sp. 221]|uniref:MraY family glycosyltransferase n=1 Tax=Paludibacter sp. 221 TaxID=2302939 RepID=UPI0013D75F89|nr:glycosyltransferase family 4 protein [Paludibacter sp. 221]NDV47261.1 UDP-GlcNAc--UDP-phosphate GlcNAc-1-phosphate transferase [Paludibacter sp. 221]